MNTLSRQITAQFFANPDDFDSLRAYWRELVNSERKHELQAVHHLLYLALRGRDWRKAFRFPTNPRKVKNGHQPELFHALHQLAWPIREEEVLAPFDAKVTPIMLARVRGVLAHVLRVQPSADPAGQLICEAYASVSAPIEAPKEG